MISTGYFNTSIVKEYLEVEYKRLKIFLKWLVKLRSDFEKADGIWTDSQQELLAKLLDVSDEEMREIFLLSTNREGKEVERTEKDFRFVSQKMMLLKIFDKEIASIEKALNFVEAEKIGPKEIKGSKKKNDKKKVK
jgi:hypothetical protein